jgi:hypothetical protein
MTTLEKMLDIKTRYNALKCPKTKAAREKYWDKQVALRREMFDLVEANQEEVSQLIVKHAKSLNVMAPLGGPWGLGRDSAVELYSCNGTYFTLSLDGQWVGLVHLMENHFGMDNVLILSKVA